MGARYSKRLRWVAMTMGRQEARLVINGLTYVVRITPNSAYKPSSYGWEIWSTTPDNDKVVGRGVAHGATGRERAVTAARTRLGEIELETP